MIKAKGMFLVATSGKTTDGRELSATDIVAIALNYNALIYTAPVITSLEKPLELHGIVKSLQAVTLGNGAGLYAEIKVDKHFMDQARSWVRNVHFAISVHITNELLPSPYLICLYPTEDPCCLGTDVITPNALAECVA